MRNILSAVERIVREAGQLAKDIPPRSRVLRHKKHGGVATEGDIRVEEYVISSLRKLFPDHGFDSEERGQENTNAEYVWILDPIDGTSYYAKDIPLYSISLALEKNKELVLGVVYSPELDRMYCSSAGMGGATLNGVRICCSGEDQLERAFICLEIPSRDSSSDEQQWALEKTSTLVKEACRIRIIGVGSLGLCFCASGGFDAYINLGCKWKYCDIAAGQVIVRAAGGEFSYLGKQNKQIVAGPAGLCDKIRDVLKI
jgi:myo-inositol-1(or 4)-monophosphatase